MKLGLIRILGSCGQGLIFLVIYLEFGMYVFLRQIVTGFEWVVASTSSKFTSPPPPPRAHGLINDWLINIASK